MSVEIEVFRTQKLDDPVIVLVVDEDRAEQRSFRVDVAGKRAF
jgi:hypothetical protein